MVNFTSCVHLVDDQQPMSEVEERVFKGLNVSSVRLRDVISSKIPLQILPGFALHNLTISSVECQDIR